jgi:hypothetical protein
MNAMPKPARRVRLSLALVSAVALLAALLCALPAIASGPPTFVPFSPPRTLVRPTRAWMQVEYNSNGLETQVSAAYIEAHALEEAEHKKEPPPWIVTTRSTGFGSGSGLELSLPGPEHYTWVRHLKPETAYVARFTATNSAGSAEERVPFTTLPVGKPEITESDRFSHVFDEPVQRGLVAFATDATTAQIGVSSNFEPGLETNGAEITAYSLEIAPSESGPWTTCGAGSVTLAEEFAAPQATCTGLSPETTYFTRAKATNEKGTVEATGSLTTPTLKPLVGGAGTEVRNVTGMSARDAGGVIPHGLQTSWRFETSSSDAGPWTPVPGAAGTISQAEAEALPFGGAVHVAASLTGLSPSTTYFVRLFAESSAGEGEYCDNLYGCQPIASTKIPLERLLGSEIGEFTTAGPPFATTFATHALHGEAVRLIGSVDPNSTPTSAEQRITLEGSPTGGTFTLAFGGKTTKPLAFDASAGEAAGPGSLDEALRRELGLDVAVTGPDGGPYTVFFNEPAGVAEPTIECHAELTPSGSCAVATTQAGGEAYDTHYHFEYEPEEGPEPFAHATSTPAEDAGSGTSSDVVAADLPTLTPGAKYRYRLVATSTAPGNPVVTGETQTLTAPTPAPVETPTCPNEAERTGPSSNLPDCRAYEQLTPVNKEGAHEAFNYHGLQAFALAGEDGEHLMLSAEGTSWGSGPGAGHGPYFFSRATGGWSLTAAGSEPELGPRTMNFEDYLLDPALDHLGAELRTQTTPANQSKEVEFISGPPGGPYTTAATVPRSDVIKGGGSNASDGWVAASPDFSKLILQVADPHLVEPATTTKAGLDDLYEYVGGELRQLNAGIGSCGAHIVVGREMRSRNAGGAPHAVSADGARVLFEATPGNDCSAPSHLYERVDASETVDIGAYTFLAANAAGTRLLLASANAESDEFFLYDTAAASAKHLFTVVGGFSSSGFGLPSAAKLVVSPGLDQVYFISQTPVAGTGTPAGNCVEVDCVYLYHYDLTRERLRFLAQLQGLPESSPRAELYTTGDGKQLFFAAHQVYGVPGRPPKARSADGEGESSQLYRFDSGENVIACVSCTSAFDPEPQRSAYFRQREEIAPGGATFGAGPYYTPISANGDFAFFVTTAALLPSDVDGEIEAEYATSPGEFASESGDVSPSTDVYEWRRDGIDGCGQLQGCLSLITNGQGGYFTMLLGTAHEGRDVFFYTSSQLGPNDHDKSGDIYDARIGGGFPPLPPRPVECEGEQCSTPAKAPDDATPSSFTFDGAGNLVSVLPTASSGDTKRPTARQLLAAALRQCHERYPRSRRKRARCERTAHHRYGTRKEARR